MIAAAFGCPFKERVPPGCVMSLVQEAMDARPDEVALDETIKVAVPTAVARLFRRLRPLGIPLRVCPRNIRNTGHASADGIGDCPFAPRATGTIAAADLAYLLDGRQVRHGIDRRTMAALDPWLTTVLGHAVPATLGKTDPSPPEPP